MVEATFARPGNVGFLSNFTDVTGQTVPENVGLGKPDLYGWDAVRSSYTALSRIQSGRAEMQATYEANLRRTNQARQLWRDAGVTPAEARLDGTVVQTYDHLEVLFALASDLSGLADDNPNVRQQYVDEILNLQLKDEDFNYYNAAVRLLSLRALVDQN